MTKKRKRRKSNGGGQRERIIAKELSRWWTDGKRDDVFWRSHSSGARATARGKRGVRTQGHHGDTCASDPIGEPLINAFTIEIKKGRTAHTIAHLLDAQDNRAKPLMYEEWFLQTITAHKAAGSFAWMLIVHRRAYWQTIVFLPEYAWHALMTTSASAPGAASFFSPQMQMKFYLKNSGSLKIVCVTLQQFLEFFDPGEVAMLAEM
jgi:hypothetical protein